MRKLRKEVCTTENFSVQPPHYYSFRLSVSLRLSLHLILTFVLLLPLTSGSGKTTLLSLLGGHTRNGIVSGERLLNRQQVSLDEYEHFMRQQGDYIHIYIHDYIQTYIMGGAYRNPLTLTPWPP